MSKSVMARGAPKAREARRRRFLVAARGLSLHQTSLIMSHYTRGIDWSGTSKGRMAEAYADGVATEDVIAGLERARYRRVSADAPPTVNEQLAAETEDSFNKWTRLVNELRSDISIDASGMRGAARTQVLLALLSLDEARLRLQLAEIDVLATKRRPR